MAQLVHEESWEVKRFHLWYMEASKAGLHGFTVKVLAEYFHLTTDAVLPWTSTTCIDYYGKMTLTSPKSPCFLCK
jgi:hypothetical protein